MTSSVIRSFSKAGVVQITRAKRTKGDAGVSQISRMPTGHLTLNHAVPTDGTITSCLNGPPARAGPHNQVSCDLSTAMGWSLKQTIYTYPYPDWYSTTERSLEYR